MSATLQADVDRQTVATFDPVWRGAVEAKALTPLDKAVIGPGVRVAGGNPPVAYAAQSSTALTGGLIPADRWPEVEFGSNRTKITTYQRHYRSGKVGPVTRNASRQLPVFRKTGRVAYAALSDVAPRVVSLWTQMIMAKSAEALGVRDG